MKKKDMKVGTVYAETHTRDWESNSWKYPDPVKVLDAQTWNEDTFYSWFSHDKRAKTQQHRLPDGTIVTLRSRIQPGPCVGHKQGVLVECLYAPDRKKPLEVESHDPPQYAVVMFKDIVAEYADAIERIDASRKRQAEWSRMRDQARDENKAALAEAVKLANTKLPEGEKLPDPGSWKTGHDFTGKELLAFVKALLA